MGIWTSFPVCVPNQLYSVQVSNGMDPTVPAPSPTESAMGVCQSENAVTSLLSVSYDFPDLMKVWMEAGRKAARKILCVIYAKVVFSRGGLGGGGGGGG